MAVRIDFVPYPPTSFPFRDLLVLEHLALGPTDSVCEIGIGSGGTTARLARLCSSVVGFEISSATVDALRYLEDRYPNLRLVVADITQTDQVAGYERQFTRAIACDTLEHVADPAAFFRAVERLLAPGGEFLVTFPNEPKDKMHGITRFDSAAELTKLMEDAGLAGCRIGAATMAPSAERVANALGWGPLKVVRRVLRRGSYKRADAEAGGASAPQTFDQTQFMRRIRTWEKISPVLNLYWYGVLQLMEQGGPAFVIDWDFRSAPFTDCQVFVTGRKPVQVEQNRGAKTAEVGGRS